MPASFKVVSEGMESIVADFGGAGDRAGCSG